MFENDPARPATAEAEEALERVQRELEASRQRRKQASYAFDDFLRSIHQKPSSPPSTSAPVVRSLPREPRPRSAEPLPPPAGIVAPEFPSREVPPAEQRASAVRAALRLPVPRVTPSRVRAAAGLTLLAAAGALFTWRVRSSDVTPAPPAVSDSRATQTSSAVPPDAPPSPDAPAAPRLNAQLTTVRPVWMRVLVDGERAIEREFPAGQKIPISAERTIVVRAGDAGAVRVTIDGIDQGSLGPDGAVATRTFAKPRF